jgi:hypothetical protein
MESLIEAKALGNCEVCGQEATFVVQDSVRLYGLSSDPLDNAPHGPRHPYCRAHSRAPETYERKNGRLVRA